MVIIRCKNCGGQVGMPEGLTAGECPYCSNLITLPENGSAGQTESSSSPDENVRQGNDTDKADAARQPLTGGKKGKKSNRFIIGVIAVIGVIFLSLVIIVGAVFLYANRYRIEALFDWTESADEAYTGEGHLEIRPVHPDNDMKWIQLMEFIKEGGDPDDSFYFAPSEAEFLPEGHIDSKIGETFTNYVLVEIHPLMTGENIKDTYVSKNQYGQYEIVLIFNKKGAARFAEITEAYVGRRLAFVIDGKLYSSPTILTPIHGGKARIPGTFSKAEAKSLAKALKRGAQH